MEEKSLFGIWRVVSWVLTVAVMFLLGLLGRMIAEGIGSSSYIYSFGGFVIGWRSYGLIKVILFKYINKNTK